MSEQLPPDQRGPDFSFADVARATVTPEQASRIIMQYQQAGQGGDPTALLAALVRQQSLRNCRFMVRSINIAGVAGASITQIADENPLRAALIINIAQPSNILSLNPDNLGILFEESSYTTRQLAVQEALTIFRRSLQPLIQSSGGLGNEDVTGNRTLIFNPPPINAVSIIENIGGNVQGVIIEGV